MIIGNVLVQVYGLLTTYNLIKNVRSSLGFAKKIACTVVWMAWLSESGSARRASMFCCFTSLSMKLTLLAWMAHKFPKSVTEKASFFLTDA